MANVELLNSSQSPDFPITNPGVRNYSTGLFKNPRFEKRRQVELLNKSGPFISHFQKSYDSRPVPVALKRALNAFSSNWYIEPLNVEQDKIAIAVE